jgi:hypothetical protein
MFSIKRYAYKTIDQSVTVLMLLLQKYVTRTDRISSRVTLLAEALLIYQQLHVRQHAFRAIKRYLSVM